MTNHATLLRQIRAEARPYIEQWLEIGEVFAGFRKLAADNDLDWGVIKALIKAEVQDEQDEEGGSKRVTKIIDKADCASAYADMLGLGGDEKNNFSSADLSPQSEINRRMTALWSAQLGKPLDQAIEEARADLPPHDEDGVIIELPPAEPVRPSADIQGSGPPSEENGPLLNNVPGNGPATAPAPGAEGLSLKGDAGETTGEATPHMLAASSINSDPHGVASEEGADAIALDAPSSPSHSPSGELTATGSNGGSHAHGVASTAHKSSDTRRSFEQDPGQALGSDPVSEVAAIAPASAAIAPVEQSPSRDVAPGAPFPCEANGWAGLEPLPQFDRRRPAA